MRFSIQVAHHLKWNSVIISIPLIEPEVVYRTVLNDLVEPVDAIEWEILYLLYVIRKYDNLFFRAVEILDDCVLLDRSLVNLRTVRREARGKEHGHSRVQRPRKRFFQARALVAAATVDCQSVGIRLENPFRCLCLFRCLYTPELQHTIPSERGTSVVREGIGVEKKVICSVVAIVNEVFLDTLYASGR